MFIIIESPQIIESPLIYTVTFFSRILPKNIESKRKQRKDRKWIQGRLRNRTRKKSKNRLRKRKKICQEDEIWNKFIYPTILSSIFTCCLQKNKKELLENHLMRILCSLYGINYRVLRDLDEKMARRKVNGDFLIDQKPNSSVVVTFD